MNRFAATLAVAVATLTGCSSLIGIDEGRPSTPETDTAGENDNDADVYAFDDGPLAMQVVGRKPIVPPSGVHFAAGPALNVWYGDVHLLFGVSDTGAVFQTAQKPAGIDWIDWIPLGGDVSGDLAVVRASLDRVSLLGVSRTTGQVSHRWWNKAWDAKWDSLPAPTTSLAHGSLVAGLGGMSRANFTFEILAKTTGGRTLYLSRESDFGSWTEVAELTGLDSAPAVAAESVASSEAFTRWPYEMAYRTNDGDLAVRRWTGKAFTAPQLLGKIEGRPSITLRRRTEDPFSPREVFVAARSLTGTLLLFRGRDGSWQGPQDLGDKLVHTPSITSRGSSELNVAILRPDGVIDFLSLASL